MHQYDHQGVVLEDLEIGINVLWISLSTYLVFLIQLGFTFLEAGSIRLKNLQSILFKNCIDYCVNTIFWWLIGYGIAFGSDLNCFMGANSFAASYYNDFDQDHLNFLFQWAFAGTSAAILSGCVAERMTVVGCLLQSVFYIAWVYPIIVHWTSGRGWLNQMGFQDYAGASTVHIAGGTAGFIATLIIKPRIGRFQARNIDDFQPNNITYCVLGTLLLWFSWYGFNCGQTLTSIGDAARLIPLIGVNTTLAAVSSALSSVICYRIVNRKLSEKYSTTVLCNGLLAGLVSTTAGCQLFYPSHSIALGFLSGIIQNRFSRLLVILEIDDPLEAISIHVGSGILGVIAVGFCDEDRGLFYNEGPKLLGIQCIGILSIIFWVIICELPLLYLLKWRNLLRVSAEIEKLGFDQEYCGGSAYSYDQVTIKAFNLVNMIEGYVNITDRYHIDQFDMQRNIKGIQREPRTAALFHANKLYNIIKSDKNNSQTRQHQTDVIIR